MKIFTIWLLVGSLIFLSCGDFTQEMWLEKDGSGQLHFSYDMGEIFALIMLMEGSGESADSAVGGMDELMTGLLKELTNSSGDVDTTMSFYDFMQEKENDDNSIEDLKNVRLNIKSVKKEESIILTLMLDFENFNHLDQMISTLSSQEENVDKTSLGDLPEFGKVFSLSKKSFEIAPYQLNFAEEVTEENIDSSDQSELDFNLEEMIETGDYVTIFHFPYRIKSCSNDQAVIKGKTLTIRQSLSDLEKNRSFPGLSVKFRR